MSSKHPGVSLSRKSDLGVITLVLRNPITEQQRRFSSKTTDTDAAEAIAKEVSKVWLEAKAKPEVWTSPPVGLSQIAYDVIGSRPLSDQIGKVIRKGLRKLPNKERQREIQEMDEAAKSIWGTGTAEGEELRTKKTENNQIKELEKKIKQLEIIANDWKKRALLAESKMRVDERRALANHDKLDVLLTDAYTSWLPILEASKLDDQYKNNQRSAARRFTEATQFKTKKLIDLVGRERDIDNWITGLGVGARSRSHVRMSLMQFFKAVGLEIDKTKLTCPKKSEIKKDRKATIWFDKPKCRELQKAFEKIEASKKPGRMPENWATLWQVHSSMGFRATEIPTLQTSCLDSECTRMTLKEVDNMTLKVGSRTIMVPETLRPIFKTLVANAKHGLLFYKKTGKPFHSPEMFCKMYLARLKVAAKACGIKEIYCDAGRNSFITNMIDAGESLEKIALYCGTSVQMIKDAYSGMKSEMVDASKGVI